MTNLQVCLRGLEGAVWRMKSFLRVYALRPGRGGAAGGQSHFSAKFPELSLGPAAHWAQPVASNEAGPRRATPGDPALSGQGRVPGNVCFSCPSRLFQCATRGENQRSQGRLSGPLALNTNGRLSWAHASEGHIRIATALCCPDMTSNPARHLLSGPVFAKPDASGTYLGQWVPGFSNGQS